MPLWPWARTLRMSRRQRRYRRAVPRARGSTRVAVVARRLERTAQATGARWGWLPQRSVHAGGETPALLLACVNSWTVGDVAVYLHMWGSHGAGTVAPLAGGCLGESRPESPPSTLNREASGEGLTKVCPHPREGAASDCLSRAAHSRCLGCLSGTRPCPCWRVQGVQPRAPQHLEASG